MPSTNSLSQQEVSRDWDLDGFSCSPLTSDQFDMARNTLLASLIVPEKSDKGPEKDKGVSSAYMLHSPNVTHIGRSFTPELYSPYEKGTPGPHSPCSYISCFQCVCLGS